MLTLQLRTKRDAVVARQRARQAAALLRFDIVEQATIAAGAFAIAVEALAGRGACPLFIRVTDGALLIDSEGASLRLVKPTPLAARSLPASEFTWMMRQLQELEGGPLFDEFRAQNQEMLHVLHLMAQARAQLQAVLSPPPPQAAA